jgi:hypothetical protein
MLPPVRPSLDPLAHRAAIQALEAQRASYARFARTMDVHRTALAGGAGDAATAAAEAAVRGHDELAEGARRLAPLVAAAQADPAAREDVGRRMDAVMDGARAAEAAIHNLTAQLEAWRDAYGRQLAELGVTPGGDGAAPATPQPAPYERPGFGGQSPPSPPRLIDRTG